jgi:hypothetical protein
MGNPRRRRSDLTSQVSDAGSSSESMPPVVDDTRGVAGIRQRAFELYETRGRESGHELDDWLTAERELLTRDDAVRDE